MNILIQKATVNDVSSLTAIQQQAFERLYQIYQDERSPYLRGSDEIKYWLENGTRDVYKIYVDNTLCGGIAILNKGKGTYRLTRLYILPDLQGKGIGRKAIELCETNYTDAKRWELDFPIDQLVNKKCYEYCGYYDTGLRDVQSDKLTLALYEKVHSGIFEIRQTQLDTAADIIRTSFSTVAKELGITKENFPTHTSFITTEKLHNHCDRGWLMYGLYDNKRMIGYVSLSKESDKIFEIHNLAVLPEYRHKGYGKQLLDFCKEKVKEMGAEKIIIGIIDENTILKNWYTANGFIHTGIKKFSHMPITAGYMEWEG